MPADMITFLSDFGWDGGYVAACEAIMASVLPQARVIHMSHEIDAGDIAGGSLVLRRVAPLCPPAVHVAIVDPGVGTNRRALAIGTGRGDFLMGPDNGLLPPATEVLGGLVSAWSLDAARVRTRAAVATVPLSATFHGRDLFAPAAALLARGDDPADLATAVDPTTLMRLAPPVWQPLPGGIVAEAVEVDRFGNVELAVPFDELDASHQVLSVEVVGEDAPATRARVVETYAELPPGVLGILRDSWGYVALAVNGASAAQLLTLEQGMMVRLSAAVRSSEDPKRTAG
jgi:S-adenosylmethionine hydrolase